ncbi:hypothetical protein BDR26DRAFT_931873 [Obelidium mucronatum]|nr:hypothetical protein BDR26DRAFT_931873 [Obelidium mucronatum]
MSLSASPTATATATTTAATAATAAAAESASTTCVESAGGDWKTWHDRADWKPAGGSGSGGGGPNTALIAAIVTPLCIVFFAFGLLCARVLFRRLGLQRAAAAARPKDGGGGGGNDAFDLRPLPSSNGLSNTSAGSDSSNNNNNNNNDNNNNNNNTFSSAAEMLLESSLMYKQVASAPFSIASAPPLEKIDPDRQSETTSTITGFLISNATGQPVPVQLSSASSAMSGTSTYLLQQEQQLFAQMHAQQQRTVVPLQSNNSLSTSATATATSTSIAIPLNLETNNSGSNMMHLHTAGGVLMVMMDPQQQQQFHLQHQQQQQQQQEQQQPQQQQQLHQQQAHDGSTVILVSSLEPPPPYQQQLRQQQSTANSNIGPTTAIPATNTYSHSPVEEKIPIEENRDETARMQISVEGAEQLELGLRILASAPPPPSPTALQQQMDVDISATAPELEDILCDDDSIANEDEETDASGVTHRKKKRWSRDEASSAWMTTG